ncbi:MAG: family 1 glycosylhydrolase, partial [Actinomycetota bacterium]|nr:family 1 glycosylhydrolase [Actinomycetota bacterium]
ALDLRPAVPAGNAPEDAAAAARVDGAQNRWFLDPLFGRGYPGDVLSCYRDLFPDSAAAEVATFHGRLDFLGVNYYTRSVVRRGEAEPLRGEEIVPAGAETTATGWEVYPDGLRELLLRLRRDYGPLPLAVTENGAAYDDRPAARGRVDDGDRLRFLERHLDAAAGAVAAGVPLEAYFVWSLLDNFEWAEGYAKRFGIVHVDYATQRRTVKASGAWYAALVDAWRRAR